MYNNDLAQFSQDFSSFYLYWWWNH
jgi:hypothetical protein